MTGAEIKERREALHLTQVELAAAIDYHPNTVARWERGELPVPGWLGLALDGLEAGGWSGPAQAGPQALAAWMDGSALTDRERELAATAFRSGWSAHARQQQAIITNLSHATNVTALVHLEPRTP